MEATNIHLARSLGQDEAILKQVENRTLHSAMAAFGLWRDEAQFDDLAEEIILERQSNKERRNYANDNN